MRIPRDCYANLVAALSHVHSCECRENFHVSQTSRELVAKVLNMFKNWMRIFFPKIFQYFARLSRDGRANVANLSPRKFGELKLVSHWHANSSRLLREFSRGTFARHSCECRENFHGSRTSRELVAKVLNMFKNWMRFFFSKYFARLSRDCRATVVRRSCECRKPVAAKFCRIYNAKFSRHSYECRASVAGQSRDSLETTCEKLATIWRENKT